MTSLSTNDPTNWKKKERRSWCGAYRTKRGKRVFVVLCFMELVKEPATEKTVLYEYPLAVPLNWISKCWRFVALPARDTFYYPSSHVSSTDQRYNDLVSDGFEEFRIGCYIVNFGCKYNLFKKNFILKIPGHIIENYI